MDSYSMKLGTMIDIKKSLIPIICFKDQSTKFSYEKWDKNVELERFICHSYSDQHRNILLIAQCHQHKNHNDFFKKDK